MQGNNEVREETLGGAARAQPSATVQNVGHREMQSGHFPILQDGQHWVLPKMLLLSCLFASALLPLHLEHLLLISSVWCRAYHLSGSLRQWDDALVPLESSSRSPQSLCSMLQRAAGACTGWMLLAGDGRLSLSCHLLRLV